VELAELQKLCRKKSWIFWNSVKLSKSPNEHQNEQKKLIFTARNPQIFDHDFSQWRWKMKELTQFKISIFCFPHYSRRSDLWSEVSFPLFRLSQKKKNSTRYPKRLKSDEKTQKNSLLSLKFKISTCFLPIQRKTRTSFFVLFFRSRFWRDFFFQIF
jgi:hypothetical protein